jgi:hypothetical protein
VTEGVDSTLTNYYGYSLVSTSEKIIVFRNSYLESAYNGGFMLRVGMDDWYTNHEGKLDSTQVYGNKFVELPGGNKHTIMAGYNKDYNIRYNYFDTSYYGIVHEGGNTDHTPTSNEECHLKYNIFHEGYMGIITKGHDSVVISNNTFYSSQANSLFFILIASSDTGGDSITEPYPQSKNIKIYNNIFYSTSTTTHAIRLGNSTDAAENTMDTIGFESDYNIFYYPNRTNNEPVFQYCGTTYSWTQWRALGYDANSIILDPNFQDVDELIPTARLDYGTDLGTGYDYGLDTNATWVVDSFIDTLQQNGNWQVGAYVFPAAGGASTETDILSFVLADQTGEATINTTNHTVSIEVAYGTTVTSLSPTITVSAGATIDPTSGTARDFTNPVTYDVTAEDAVTEQEWTVTVTVADLNPYGGTYFVAHPDSTYSGMNASSDSNDGSFANPWATWAKALNSGSVSAGDTIYVRGGTYLQDTTGYTSDEYNFGLTPGVGMKISIDGTINDTTKFWAYPGETPILDGTNVHPQYYTYKNNYAIKGQSVNYVHLKGLEIQNFAQYNDYMGSGAGILIEFSDNVIIEECVVHDGHGTGFGSKQNTNIYFTNCDAYNMNDPYGDYIGGEHNVSPGNDGYGFTNINQIGEADSVYYSGCRAWGNGDDGFSSGNQGYTQYENCWSFNNGLLEGAGNGFKMGWINIEDGELHSVYAECVAYNNRASGFTTNDGGYAADSIRILNCTSIDNGTWYELDADPQYNYVVFNTTSTDAVEQRRVFQNNIGFNGYDGNILEQGDYTDITNTWTTGIGFTLNSEDFITLDSATVTAAMLGDRQSDGSLPDIGNSLKLSETSDAIDAGTDIGYGDDLGAFQYSEQVPAEAPTVVTGQVYNISTTSCIVIGNNTDDGGGDVSQKGVCWSTSENPSLDDDYTDEGAGAGAFTSSITGLSDNTTYYVRAYATNEVVTSYGDNVSFTTRKGGVIIGGDGNVTFIKGKIYIKK